MKITKRQLKRIIREEKSKLHTEGEMKAALAKMSDEIVDVLIKFGAINADPEADNDLYADAVVILSDVIIPDLLTLSHTPPLREDKSGKGKCPDSGCIKKSGDDWRIVSNKTGKLWPQKYKTRKSAESALDAYHASR